MIMKRWASTQFILIALTVMIFLGTFFSVSWFTNHLLTTKQAEVLVLERDGIAEETERHFDVFAGALLNLSDAVRHRPDDEALLFALMADVNHRLDAVYTVYFGRPDNTMINVSGFEPPAGFDLRERPWYTAALNADKPVATHAFLNATEDRIVVTVAYAVHDEDTLLGVMAMDIDLMAIQTLIGSKTVGEGGYAFLIDSAQHLLAHPLLDPTERVIVDVETALGPFSFEPESTVKMMTFLGVDGEGAVTTKAIFCGQFTLGVFMPASEYHATRQLYLIMSLATVLLISALITALALFQHRRVIRPVRTLVADIAQINLATRLQYRLPVASKDAFKALRQALNAVLETTEHHYLHKTQAERALLLEGQKIKAMMDASEDIMFQINRLKQYTWISGRKLAIFGRDPEYYIGKNVLEVFGDAAIERDRLYDQVLKGETKTFEWHASVNEERHSFSTIMSPIRNERGEIIGAVGIARDVTKQIQRHQEVERLSYQDFLTGVYNRRYFAQAMSDHDTASNMPLGLFMIDVNGLKIFNDVYGHETGDDLLKIIAATLKHHLPSPHVLARIGGDEFAALLPNTDALTMQALQAQITENIANTQLKGIPLSVSVGYDIKHVPDTSVGVVLKTAENGMYRHKLSEGKQARHRMINIMYKQLFEAHPHEQEHAQSVSELSVAIGTALDFNKERLKALELAALYHDIGKISLQRDLLDKAGNLTDEEREQLKQHTEAGYLLLRAADAYAAYAETALFHHEHYDGSGYPQGLAGKSIPLFSRIVGLAEAYDAMTRQTPYRAPRPAKTALAEIRNMSGKQFDPDLVSVFIKHVAPTLIQDDTSR
ncbi:MAG: diguanylate cyclase [Acholeplasmatales bacterium]|nr:MAG: diguanylate cyclase [Acholeplasmatales bacterium]